MWRIMWEVSGPIPLLQDPLATWAVQERLGNVVTQQLTG